MCWQKKISLLEVNVILRYSMITVNVLIDSISVYLSSTLDSPRPCTRNWVYLSYICRHFSYQDINMNTEISRAPLISKKKTQIHCKIIVFSSIVQLFRFWIKEYWKVIKTEEHLTSPFFEIQCSCEVTEIIQDRSSGRNVKECLLSAIGFFNWVQVKSE